MFIGRIKITYSKTSILIFNFHFFLKEKMEDVIKTLIRQVIFKEGNTFDLLSAAMHRYTSESVHSLQEMKAKQTTKAKGDLFEAFCKVYLRTKYEEVWSLKDLPEDKRKSPIDST